MRDLLFPSTQALSEPGQRQLVRAALVTALGFALYGFSVGYWRSPMMGLFVAIKFPLLIASTLACNGLLNGLLALLLGSGLDFRQSLHSLLNAFAISALILGALAPVTFFLAVSAPPPDSPQAQSAHAAYLVTHTCLIALAGSVGVLKLRSLLHAWCPNRHVALSTLAAWIAGNAFIGAQLSWVLRPFFGSPGLKVAFLRERPMQGSFYEAVWGALERILHNSGIGVVPAILLALLVLLLLTPILLSASQPQTP